MQIMIFFTIWPLIAKGNTQQLWHPGEGNKTGKGLAGSLKSRVT